MVAKAQRSFASGELSPLLHARSDLEQYQAGLARCRDMIVLPQGGATRRPGTLHTGYAKTATVRLEDLVFNRTQSYAIELGALYARVWSNGGQVLSGGLPVEVVTPYTADDLAELWPLGAGDRLYLLHGGHPPAAVRRLGPATFDYWPIPLKGGPFRDANEDETKTLQASAATGAGVILTAGGHTPFLAGHVGALWRLEQPDLSSIPKWAGNASVAPGDLVWSFGACYECTSGGTTVNAPDHDEGAQPDAPGAGAVVWEYRHDGAGIVQVTGFTDTSHVTVTVLRELPAELVAAPTWKWSEGAWSGVRGYPAVGIFQEQRFVLFGGPSQPGAIWMSRTARFDDFEAGDLDDDAVAYTIAARQQHPIVWAAAGANMAIGTEGGEWAVGASSTREPITPTNIVITPGTNEGGAPIVPVTVNGAHLFVTSDRERLHELAYDFQSDGLRAPDLSALSEHLALPGIRKLVWQARPFRLLWLLLEDGGLAGVTYRRDEQMVAWSSHPAFGPDGTGLVVDGCCIPAPDGRRDELWLAVSRTVDGTTSTRIERLAPPWRGRRDADLADAVYLDAALTYEGAPAAVFSGLDHLEGETVGVLGEGARLPDQVVTGGEITLPRSVTKAVIGKRYTSSLRTLPIDEGAPDGVARGRLRRIDRVAASLFECFGGEIVRPAIPGKFAEEVELIAPSGGQDWNAVTLYTGDRMLPFPGGWDRVGEVELRWDGPGPATVRAIVPQYQTSPS